MKGFFMYRKHLKNLAVLVLSIMLFCGCSKNNSINFDSKSYELQFSKKSPLTGGYINEYIRPDENIKNWTDMIGVYHYPKASSPITLAKEFATIVKATNKDAGVSVLNNEKENMAIIDFLTWAPTKGTGKVDYLEFNVFKFKKNKNNGVVGIQYVHRYDTKSITPSTSKSVAKAIKENRFKYVRLIIKTSVPEIINHDISK